MSHQQTTLLPLTNSCYSGVKGKIKKVDKNKRIKKTMLDGKTWLQYSISVWNDIRKTGDEVRLRHPAMFPTMLPRRLVDIFTQPGDLVLDPFAGIGSTLIAAQEKNRTSVGIELSSKFVKLYEQRLSQSLLFQTSKSRADMHNDDARNLLKYVNPNSVKLTVTSPPYWDILNQERTADGKSTRNYGATNGNIGDIKDYQLFLKALNEIFEKIYVATVDVGGFCCVVVMDIRKKDKYYPFHTDVCSIMRNIGFELDDIVIWDRRQEYNNLRPLGYPTVFRVNKIHEYILIFKKR